MSRTTVAMRRASIEQQEAMILLARSQVQALTTLRVVIEAIINSLTSILRLQEVVEDSVRREHEPLFVHAPHCYSLIPVRRHRINQLINSASGTAGTLLNGCSPLVFLRSVSSFYLVSFLP